MVTLTDHDTYRDMDQKHHNSGVELCSTYRDVESSKITVIAVSPAAFAGFRQPSRLGNTPCRDGLPTVMEGPQTVNPPGRASPPLHSRVGCASKTQMSAKRTLTESENYRTRKYALANRDQSTTAPRSELMETVNFDVTGTSTRVPDISGRETHSQTLLKDGSFVTTLNKDSARTDETCKRSARLNKKKVKKGIFISYSPDAGFLEKMFIVESVCQLKENNLADDIWFDKDEKLTDKPCWLSTRMEAMEKCRAALLIVSDSYLACPVSMYESKALLERRTADSSSVAIYTVLYNLTVTDTTNKTLHGLLTHAIDLTAEHMHKSLAEKTSILVGSLMEELDKHACIHAPLVAETPHSNNFTGSYTRTKISDWKPHDLQEWLFHLGIKEFYQQSFAELMVDGFLLMAITDHDMIHHLSIDSRAVRKKIMQGMLTSLDREMRAADSWHLRARTQRPRAATVYLVYDPADVRLAQNLKQDLSKKNIQVLHHQKLGESKDEFLRFNAHQMATASTVLLVLTNAATRSPFVYNELLFVEWLGKRVVTAMFNNVWTNLRPSLRAVLGDCQAVDFERKMYPDSLSVLEHHIKPKNNMPVVVLEQAFITKMADGVQPLAQLANVNASGTRCIRHAADPVIFISYQWDAQSLAERLRHLLETAGITCCADACPTAALTRGHGRSDGGQMRVACVVVSCITQKYAQSESGARDLRLAEALRKPIVPVMLRFTQWPPEGASPHLRRLLARYTPVDMSNEKLFRQNTATFIERLRRLVTTKS